MAFFENISLALGNLRSNKMRSLLTMLGIIIGIAAVIAIETIGNSMTGAVTDSMSGLGVSNITVSLTQKTESDQSAMSGVQLRLFMDSTPSDGDLLTDEMIAEYTAAFPTQVADVQKTVTGGSATLDKLYVYLFHHHHHRQRQRRQPRRAGRPGKRHPAAGRPLAAR